LAIHGSIETAAAAAAKDKAAALGDFTGRPGFLI
jgi:hypothetical protein